MKIWKNKKMAVREKKSYAIPEQDNVRHLFKP